MIAVSSPQASSRTSARPPTTRPTGTETTAAGVLFSSMCSAFRPKRRSVGRVGLPYRWPAVIGIRYVGIQYVGIRKPGRRRDACRRRGRDGLHLTGRGHDARRTGHLHRENKPAHPVSARLWSRAMPSMAWRTPSPLRRQSRKTFQSFHRDSACSTRARALRWTTFSASCCALRRFWPRRFRSGMRTPVPWYRHPR